MVIAYVIITNLILQMELFVMIHQSIYICYIMKEMKQLDFLYSFILYILHRLIQIKLISKYKIGNFYILSFLIINYTVEYDFDLGVIIFEEYIYKVLKINKQ